MKAKKIIRIISAAIFAVCIAILLFYLITDARDNWANKQLEALKNSEAEVPDVLSEYAALYNENNETIGWLTIDGTEIDNVVMYAPNDINKYLHCDFYGSYSTRGCLFLDEYCDIFKSDNLIIYGHNMKDGTMFGTLPYFAEESFYKEHNTFTFDTIYEKQTYEVVAAIKTEIPPEDVDCFRYYEYTGKNDTEMFRQYVQFIEENRLYDTGVELQEGDDILTLSTCAYHTEQGRFIVVARKIS